MDIAKLCMQNVMIRGYLVKKVYGIYVHGIKTKIESPYNFIRGLRKNKGQEILDEHNKKNPWGVSLNVNREINFRLECRKPGEKPWYGQCPHSTEKDVPFDHGCQIYTFGGSLDDMNEEFTFFLIGKNNCKRLEKCTIRLAKKIGMNPEVNYLEGMKKSNAEMDIEWVISKLF